MKSHRPWQPHMSSNPLFNPYAPTAGRITTLDHFDFAEEEEQRVESTAGQAADPQAEQPPVIKPD